MDLKTQFAGNTAALIEARRKLAECREASIEANELLANRKAGLIMDGDIIGKNDKERDACMRSMTDSLRHDANIAEGRERAAELELKTLKDERRLLENLLMIETMEA